MPKDGRIGKIIGFITSNKWMRILYIIATIAFCSWFVLSDKSCSYEKNKGFNCNSKSTIDIEYKKGN